MTHVRNINELTCVHFSNYFQRFERIRRSNDAVEQRSALH